MAAVVGMTQSDEPGLLADLLSALDDAATAGGDEHREHADTPIMVIRRSFRILQREILRMPSGPDRARLLHTYSRCLSAVTRTVDDIERGK
ncbi:MAG: hypothetical protein ABL912_01805 [Novosphingobium sp.]